MRCSAALLIVAGGAVNGESGGITTIELGRRTRVDLPTVSSPERRSTCTA